MSCVRCGCLCVGRSSRPTSVADWQGNMSRLGEWQQGQRWVLDRALLLVGSPAQAAGVGVTPAVAAAAAAVKHSVTGRYPLLLLLLVLLLLVRPQLLPLLLLHCLPDYY